MTTITIEIDDSGAIVLQGAEGAEYVENGLEGDTEAPEGESCPIATQNIAANLEARDNAIEVANYGPLDPGRENADYWGAAADRWSLSVEEVKTARCGNCAAFNITSRIRACIADGVGGADAWEVVDAGDLGYCEAFDFKCASARRCDAWVQGGPLTDELAQSMQPQPGDEDDMGQDEVEIKIVAPAWMAANARQGISWVNEGYGGDGLTPQTLREARLMAGGTVSEDKAARMAAWFARHMVDLNAPAAMVGAEGYPSNGVVAHALWGGGSMTDSKRAAAWARARTAGSKAVSAAVRAGLEKKVEDHNEEYGDTPSKRVTLRMLAAVFERGIGAYNTNPGSVRPSVSSPEQWAYARVNAFLFAVRTGKYKGGKFDTDLLPEDHPMATGKAEMYGGVDREDLTDADFVLPGRKFPVMTAQDVRDAVSSWGRYEGPITFEQFKRRLIALAKRKDLVNALPQSWRDEMAKNINVQMVGGAVKALGEGKIGGYLVRFTDMQSPDLTGDYFTADTELGTVEALPVLYHHGQDAMIGKRVLGSGKLRKDDIGLWVEAQLALRDEYEASIYKLAEDGKLGWSSGAVAHLVEREQKTASVSWIKMWWVAEASLTPTPAEPRNEAATMKSGEAATPEDAVKASASVATENDGTENITEDTTMDNTNEIAELKASIAALTAQVNEPKVEAGKAAAVVGALGGDHDGHKAFTHWLRTGQKNSYTRTESEDWSSTKTGMTEGTGTAGGVLVPEGLYNQIVAKRDEQSIARRAGAMVIQTSLDSVQVPTENNKAAFVLRGEASAYTESLPTFTSRLVAVYNFSNMIKASNELLADQQASMDAFLVNVLGRGLAKIENEYVVTGSGSAQPLGIQAGGTAGITFAGASALTIADVLGLFFALPEPYTVGSPGPVWVMKNATLALIRALTTTNFAFNQVEQAGSSQSGAMLYGYPVIVSAAMPAATTGLKSVSLVNFASSTVLVERSGLVVSRNPYLYEEYGQTAIFSTARFGFSVTTAEGAIFGTQA